MKPSIILSQDKLNILKFRDNISIAERTVFRVYSRYIRFVTDSLNLSLKRRNYQCYMPMCNQYVGALQVGAQSAFGRVARSAWRPLKTCARVHCTLWAKPSLGIGKSRLGHCANSQNCQFQIIKLSNLRPITMHMKYLCAVRQN